MNPDRVTTFADLTAAATVGPGNRPVALDRLPAEFGSAPTGADPGPALLAAAAAYTVARRATGHTLPANELPDPPPVAAETRSLPSPRYLGAFRQLFRQRAGIVNELLVEALSRLGERGYRLPPALLPALLDRAIFDRTLREHLAPVLGEAGHHLVALNPAWVPVTPPEQAADPAVWEYGTPSQRVAYLTALRSRDPGAARDLLQADFDTHGTEERARLLGALATGLGPADEAFLESVLDGGSTTVADVARELLAGLPDSAFVGRLLARARVAITYTPTSFLRRQPGSVTITEITADTEEDRQRLARDGLKPARGSDPAGQQVRRLLGWIPPAAWPALGYTATDLVRADWGAAMTGTGPQRAPLARAALRYRDATVAAALLEAEAPTEGLADLVPSAVLLRRWDIRLAGSRPTSVLSMIPKQWDDEFAVGMLRFLDQLVRAPNGRHSPLVTQLAHTGQTRFPIGEAATYAAALRRIAAVDTHSAAVLLDTATTLELRVALLKELP
ncbi:DUF5691 domain-containing protein [Granulicoccus phenolivorans]|uniref:DUF5691 domain-containing protein n=1 Tax=Granulicoccus phenolivorans TaxID=266854 RepID=UPI00047E3FBA|nr:DUF5691 domain-containing protein [Granulicoccus phenolivorans]